MTATADRPSTDIERLPLRLEGRLARILGTEADKVEVIHGTPGELPNLRCVLPRAANASISLVLRVHSAAGIPLVAGSVDVEPGDAEFNTAQLAVLAMEGYAHLTAADRHAVEARVWSRRAFATASLVTASDAS
jgi:hypothetical protein